MRRNSSSSKATREHCWTSRALTAQLSQGPGPPVVMLATVHLNSAVASAPYVPEHLTFLALQALQLFRSRRPAPLDMMAENLGRDQLLIKRNRILREFRLRSIKKEKKCSSQRGDLNTGGKSALNLERHLGPDDSRILGATRKSIVTTTEDSGRAERTDKTVIASLCSILQFLSRRSLTADSREIRSPEINPSTSE